MSFFNLLANLGIPEHPDRYLIGSKAMRDAAKVLGEQIPDNAALQSEAEEARNAGGY